MTVRVLVVDDSGFFRRRVKEILDADSRIEVIGEAVNGAEAVDKAAQLRPDAITMDIEMPVMDGITAVKRIMATRPIPILMFSSLTTDGARATLDALEAGAVDFLPKKFEDISRDREEAKKALCDQVCAVVTNRSSAAGRVTPGIAGKVTSARPAVASRTPATPPVTKPVSLHKGQFKIVAIGTSTGGPVALQEVLTKLPASFPLPLLLIQHMPGSFTPAFAQRMNQLCKITVKQAEDGDPLTPGTALLAPGGKQMLVESRGGQQIVRIVESTSEQTYKPSVDITFGSVARTFPGKTLAIVLTGMGADGREGARKLKQGGSMLWAQDEASCVVYGMPAAVADAGLTDQVLPLKDIGPTLAQRI